MDVDFSEIIWLLNSVARVSDFVKYSCMTWFFEDLPHVEVTVTYVISCYTYPEQNYFYYDCIFGLKNAFGVQEVRTRTILNFLSSKRFSWKIPVCNHE